MPCPCDNAGSPVTYCSSATLGLAKGSTSSKSACSCFSFIVRRRLEPRASRRRARRRCALLLRAPDALGDGRCARVALTAASYVGHLPARAGQRAAHLGAPFPAASPRLRRRRFFTPRARAEPPARARFHVHAPALTSSAMLRSGSSAALGGGPRVPKVTPSTDYRDYELLEEIGQGVSAKARRRAR